MNEDLYKIPAFDENLPFRITHAGITHKDSTYRTYRKNSKITVVEFILDGKGTIKTPSGDVYPMRGDTYIIEQGNDQEYFSDKDDPWEKIWVNMSGELVPSLLKAYSIKNKIVFHCDSSKYIYTMHDILTNENLTPKERLVKCSLCFHEMVQFLADNAEPDKKISSDAEMMKSYIDANIYKQLSIGELSSLIYKSPAQAIRIFKRNFAMTPYDYYMEKRINTAIELLEYTNFSVKEIAYKLDFKDEHYFSSIFHNKTGRKPTDYRAKNA